MICTYFLQTKALSNDYQQHQYNELRRDWSRYVFAKQCAIRIDKQQKQHYNNAVIDNDIII